MNEALKQAVKAEEGGGGGRVDFPPVMQTDPRSNTVTPPTQTLATATPLAFHIFIILSRK